MHRDLYAAGFEARAGLFQAHLARDQCGQDGQIVTGSEVADAKHPALELSQPCSERQVETLVNQSAQRIRIHFLRRDHARQHR